MEDTMNEPECYIREEEENQLMEEDDEEEELNSGKQKGLRKESEDFYSDDSGRAAPIQANAFASAALVDSLRARPHSALGVRSHVSPPGSQSGI
jgi:hypothetical protein